MSFSLHNSNIFCWPLVLVYLGNLNSNLHSLNNSYIVLQLLRMKKLIPWNSSYRGFWPVHDSLSNFCLYNILANRVCRNPETFQINHVGRPIHLFVYIEDAHTYNMPFTWSCNLRQTEISVEKYKQIFCHWSTQYCNVKQTDISLEKHKQILDTEALKMYPN